VIWSAQAPACAKPVVALRVAQTMNTADRRLILLLLAPHLTYPEMMMMSAVIGFTNIARKRLALRQSHCLAALCATPAGARNGFAEPRDWQPKSTLSRPQLATETARPAFEPAETPANCGLFVRDRETSVRIGLHGGPGRIRTSNQTVMSGRPGSTRVRSTGVARKSPGPTDANGGHTR
jgi:hypothetical protein